jgi:hypothetical protein
MALAHIIPTTKDERKEKKNEKNERMQKETCLTMSWTSIIS